MTCEQRPANEITPAILVGDPVYLTLKSGRKFLAIDAPNPKATAGVIVVHGRGVHPDAGLINPLRSQLSERGYATLSVQMPVLDLYGEHDFPAVLANAAKRADALRKVRGSGQVQVAGADHFFAGMEGELMRQVCLFLDRRLK